MINTGYLDVGVMPKGMTSYVEIFFVLCKLSKGEIAMVWINGGSLKTLNYKGKEDVYCGAQNNKRRKIWRSIPVIH